MRDHESIRQLLSLYAAGALDPAESKQVEQHAESCEACRSELKSWNLYASMLPQLPEPVVPAGLMQRTHTLMLAQRAAKSEARSESRLLAALVVFGWAASWMTWIVVRFFTGGSWIVLGANLVSGVSWSVVSTIFAWMTAAAAAALLGRRQEWKEFV